MSKKSEQLIAREEALKTLSNELGKLFDSLDKSTLETLTDVYELPTQYRYTKAHQQVLEQALKFHQNKEYAKALPLFLELAEHDSPQGAEFAGRYYSEGKGTRKSQKKAFEMFVLGKKAGSLYCDYQVAYRLFYGKGIKAQRIRGMMELEECAFLGIEEAIWDLIEIYSQGIYVEKDLDVVDFWSAKVEGEIGNA